MAGLWYDLTEMTGITLMTMTSTRIDIDSDIKSRLQRLAEAKQREEDGMLREAVEQYVAREEEAQRMARDARAAWAEFKATGLHLTEEEADAWMAKLEAGEDAELPQCHV